MTDSSIFAPLPNGKFDIFYADPPWDYKGQTQHAGKGKTNTGGAAKHYPTITLPQLKMLPVPSIAADNALLYLWTTSPHFEQALALAKAWEFGYATLAFVWDKERVNPGFYTMSQCELCFVFKRGKIPMPRGSRKERQLIREPRGEHSAKPDVARERIYNMFPKQKKLELFASKKVEGWSSWGNGVA